MDVMILDVWKSDFLLPSFDAKCLQFMLCSRICAAPVQIQTSFAPWNSPDGNLPLFRFTGNNPVTTSTSNKGSTNQQQNGFENSPTAAEPENNIVAATSSNREHLLTDFKQFRFFLRKKVPKCAVDSHLTKEELEEMLAFESFVELSLHPAYLYTIWVDEFNFSCVTSRWYGQQLIFPYGLYYVYKRRSAAKAYVKSSFSEVYTDKKIELQVMKKALYCINLLSSKLGDKKYFFGNKPTSFDALVFGYLAPLLRLPLPSDQLQVHLKSCPNLVRFIESITSIYLPLSEQEITAQNGAMKTWLERKARVQVDMKHKQSLDQPLSDEDAAKEYPLRDKILFGLTALILSAIVALHVGLIEVQMFSTREEETAKKSCDESRPKVPENFSLSMRDGHILDF